MPDEKTLDQAWLEKLKNNPVIAAIIVVGIVISAVTPFIPVAITNYIGELFGRTAQPTNGWAYVGVLHNPDFATWSSQPKIELTRQSPAPDRPYPFRIGDQVVVIAAMPQVIVDFKTKQFQNVLVPPIKLRQAIEPPNDYTGLKFSVGEHYEIADLVVAHYPDTDAVMWIRLVTR